MEKVSNEVTLDQDWVVLVMEAKRLGMTVDEIRLFLQNFRKGA